MSKSVQMMRSAYRLWRHANPWRGWQLKVHASRFLARRVNVRGERIFVMRPMPAGDFKNADAPINRRIETPKESRHDDA